MIKFGKLIRKRRREKCLTLEKLGKMCGIQKGYLSSIETGALHPPSVKVVKRLARALDLDEFETTLIAAIEKLPKEIRNYVQDAVEKKMTNRSKA